MRTKGRRIAFLLGCATLGLVLVAGFGYWGELHARYLLWSSFQDLGKNAQGYPEYRHGRTGIIFVFLPGGTFLMGSPEDEDGRTNQERQHDVKLSPFLIAKHEVNQAEWKRIVATNPSRHAGDDLPVDQVSWNDCHEFCRKTGLRLPTEAQWEYACRGGSPGPSSGPGRLDDVAWYRDSSGLRPHPVGQKAANGFGLQDMLGNVWEWCLDGYDEAFYSTPEATKLDPVQDEGSGDRVLRGGSWFQWPAACRCASRHHWTPSAGNEDVGFRLVFNLR
jgi:formylglycine-generating enzyme required for sulfatase activity